MFDDDGLWPCKCEHCAHEWYSSIVAIRADSEISCPTCNARNILPLAQFNLALSAARKGSYDFSYLMRISPQLRSGASASRERVRAGLKQL